MARGTSEGDVMTASRRTPNVLRSPRCELLPPPASRRPICRPVVRKKLGDEVLPLGDAAEADAAVGVEGAEVGVGDAGVLLGELGAMGGEPNGN